MDNSDNDNALPSWRPTALIPTFNHHAALPELCAALVEQDLPILLVDDGSDAPTRGAIDELVARHPEHIEMLRLARNRGKGAAVIAGFARAAASGYTHALQLDADAQHDPHEANLLLISSRVAPEALVSGMPRYDASVPAVRFYGRWITHLLVWLETLSRDITDSMCGFRVYPLAATLALTERKGIGSHMDFDTDIMVRLYLAGVPVRFHKVRVRYPLYGESRYRMLRDNLRMSWLHARLLAGVPGLIVRRLLSCARTERTKPS
jgi:glycosyltransferase involved in cell wall biosynthesis